MSEISERDLWIAIRAGLLGMLAILRRTKKDDAFWMEIAAELEGITATIEQRFQLGKWKAEVQAAPQVTP